MFRAKSVVPTVAEVVAGSAALIAGAVPLSSVLVVEAKGVTVVVMLPVVLVYPVINCSNKLYRAEKVKPFRVLAPPLPNSTQLMRATVLLLLLITPPMAAELF